MKLKVYFLYLIPGLVAICTPLYPKLIGSHSILTRIDEQVVAAHEDEIGSLAWLVGGLRIHDEKSVVIFDSLFPVSGELELDGGTLILNRDLIIDQNAHIVTLGTIIGNDKKFQLSSSIALMPEDSCPCNPTTVYCTDLTLVLNADLVIENTHIIFSGKSAIAGQGYKLVLKNASIICAADTTLELKNIKLDMLEKNQLRCAAITSTISLNDAVISLPDSCTLRIIKGYAVHNDA